MATEYAVQFHYEPDNKIGKCVEFVTANSTEEARLEFLKSATPAMKIDSITPRFKNQKI